MQQDVRMSFDQSGHECEPGKIDNFRTSRNGTRWSNRLDLLAANEHGPIIVELR
jgi:hypothetical protein